MLHVRFVLHGTLIVCQHALSSVCQVERCVDGVCWRLRNHVWAFAVVARAPALTECVRSAFGCPAQHRAWSYVSRMPLEEPHRPSAQCFLGIVLSGLSAGEDSCGVDRCVRLDARKELEHPPCFSGWTKVKPPSLTVIAGHIQSHGLSPMSAAITLTSVSNFTLQFLVFHVSPGAAHEVGWFGLCLKRHVERVPQRE